MSTFSQGVGTGKKGLIDGSTTCYDGFKVQDKYLPNISRHIPDKIKEGLK